MDVNLFSKYSGEILSLDYISSENPDSPTKDAKEKIVSLLCEHFAKG